MDKLRLRNLRKELKKGESANPPVSIGAASVEGTRLSSKAVDPSGANSQKAVSPENPQPVLVQSESDTRLSSPARKKRKERDTSSTHDQVIENSSANASVPPRPLPGLGDLQIKNPGACVATLFSIGHAVRLVTDYASTLEVRLKERDQLSKRLGECEAKLKEAKFSSLQYQTALKTLQGEYETEKKNWLSEKGRLESEKESLIAAKDLAEGKVASFEHSLAELKSSIIGKDKKAEELELVLLERTNECERARADLRSEQGKSVEEFEKGYAEALRHLQFLHPDEDLSRYNPWFEIVDGRLVDPDEKTDSAPKDAAA